MIVKRQESTQPPFESGMDDPWANAWGEPSKASSSNWSAPSVSTIHGDHEDDISTRSWSVEPTTHWGDTNITEASLWRNEPSSSWQPAHSTFDTVPLSTVPAQLPQLPQFPTSTSEVTEKSSSSDNSPPSSPISGTPSLSPSLSPQALHISRTATPDAFGTFKGADESDEPTEESWKPTLSLPSADADTWTPSWGESNESNSVNPPGTAEALDIAWETAKEQKARQDRHVPPELLASILRQLEEMSGELWPDTTSATEDEMSLEAEIVVPASIAQKFMPDDMTLPSNVQFTNTFISKQLTEALKLTKHAPQTRLSPMAMYMSSKGSTSWEASIKSQPNITHEDFAPAGWKIVETPKESTVIDDSKKKAGSGLLSFFGRRTNSSQSDAILRSNSPPITGPQAVLSIKTGSLPRASTDNMKSTPTSQDSGRTTPALPIAASSSSSISVQKNDPNPTTSIMASDSVVREATPPPSAVSRFLGRFSSRPKPRESLALSQDDIEFLSDVPTFSESESNQVTELDALSLMIKSTPLPTTLPPPLPPPPQASQPTRTLSQTTKLEKGPMNDPMNDDPFSIFNSSDSASTRIHTPMKPLTGVSTPPLADSRSSGSTISNQGWSLFDDLPAPANETVAAMTPPNNYSTPPPVPRPKLNAAFPILSPGSSSQKQSLGRDSLASKSTGVISPLSPPPRSSSHTPSHSAVSPPVINLDDDDDFSDFLSSPAQSAPPAPLSFTHNALVMKPSSSISQTPKTTTNSMFDGFDEFLGPISSDPQPPLPPAKQTPQPSVPASNVTTTTSPPNNRRSHTRTVSKADHSRTLSLLENVATRGRWLGPASPLPEALTPPAGSNIKSNSMQAQQAQATATLLQAPILVADERKPSQNSSRQLSPAFTFPPPVSSQPPLLKPPALHVSSISPVVTPTNIKSGGLSAQDLSFFEGL